MMASILLRDGRKLAYSEYGDPQGKPLFLFHGIPGSRIFRPPFDNLTAEKHVRLITVDRPGYGESAYQPGRRITDWPADIAQLADCLGLRRFVVCGHSGGGPYALACASKIPDRVAKVGVISSLGPPGSPHMLDGIILQNRLGFTAGCFLPWPLFRLAMAILFREGRAHPEKFVHPDNRNPENPDNAMLALPGGWQVCLDSIREAFRQGTLGHAWEGFLLIRSWGFSLWDIQAPVYIWHGGEDIDAPIGMGKAIAAQVPNGKVTVFHNEGHLLLFAHWVEILDALTLNGEG